MKAILLSNFSYGVMAATSAIAIDFSIIAISPSIPVTPIVSLEFLTHLHNTWLIQLAVLICHFVGFYFVLHFKTRAEVNFLSMLTLQPEKNGMKAKSSITISDILGGLFFKFKFLTTICEVQSMIVNILIGLGAFAVLAFLLWLKNTYFF